MKDKERGRFRLIKGVFGEGRQKFQKGGTLPSNPGPTITIAGPPLRNVSSSDDKKKPKMQYPPSGEALSPHDDSIEKWDRMCLNCDGGKAKPTEVNKDGRCSYCDGIGYIPTHEGSELLKFLYRHFYEKSS